MANILIVEDEKNMQDIIVEYIKKGGHTCFTADDGIDALMILKNNPMDLMILDIMMPHMDGFTVCKMAREMSNMPIIILTAKSDEEDKLKGYEYGADDYMTKPFSLMVLRARIEKLLNKKKVVQKLWQFGNLELDFEHMRFLKAGICVELSKTEQRILYLLVFNAGQILTRERLLEWV